MIQAATSQSTSYNIVITTIPQLAAASEGTKQPIVKLQLFSRGTISWIKAKAVTDELSCRPDFADFECVVGH
jgi:hypothetical protein